MVETLSHKPLVTVGVPVRNGATQLSMALESLINQTYKHIEIVISDNCSNDETRLICESYVESYGNIKYFRHSEVISALENFKWVFSVARGEYFMWAAHDDLRSENYVEVLLDGLLRNGANVLSYTNVNYFNESGEQEKSIRKYDFSTIDSRVIGVALGSCVPIYGIIRRRALENYRWYNPLHGPDRAMLTYLICLGEFSFVDGALLKYYSADKQKTIKQRARENSMKSLVWFPHVQEAWCCCAAASDAINDDLLFSRIRLFLIIYAARFKKNRFSFFRKKLKQILK